MASENHRNEFYTQNRGVHFRRNEVFILLRNMYKADFITGKNNISVEALTEDGIDRNQIKTCKLQGFERPIKTKRNIYKAPHILIRLIVGEKRIPIVFTNKYLTFPFGIVGIHAPKHLELSELFDYLNKNNELFRAYILATSGRVMIGKATAINKEDIMRIPYSQNIKNTKQTEVEKIIVKQITNNRPSEDTIVNAKEIIKFSSVFCKILNSIYQKEKSFQLFKIIDAGKYYALHFEYTKEALSPKQEKITDLEQYIEEAIPTRNDNQQKIHIQRIIKAYGQDFIILAKPKQLRYWLPSIALRDADETFADYIKSRYHNA